MEVVRRRLYARDKETEFSKPSGARIEHLI